MAGSFISDLKATFNSHTFTETKSKNTDLFVYEVKDIDSLGHTIKKTIFEDTKPSENHFHIVNSVLDNEVTHICIDGDFITYGQRKYDDSNKKFDDGRPDCIIFDNNTFLFIELKLEQEPTSWDKEDTKWKAFFRGVTQIEDFVNYWRGNGFEIKNYYQNIVALVCMRFEPNFSRISRGNNARNTEIFKRSQRLGFRIFPHNHQNKYQL